MVSLGIKSNGRVGITLTLRRCYLDPKIDKINTLTLYSMNDLVSRNTNLGLVPFSSTSIDPFEIGESIDFLSYVSRVEIPFIDSSELSLSLNENGQHIRTKYIFQS